MDHNPNPPPEQRVTSVKRFEDPRRFLAFYDQQLSKQVAGITHKAALPKGTEVLLYIHLPAQPEPLKIAGIARESLPQPNGVFGVKLSLYMGLKEQAWLEAFVAGARGALSFAKAHIAAEARRMSQPIPNVSTPNPPSHPASMGGRAAPRTSGKQSMGNALQVLVRIDGLLEGGSYYEILGVDPDIEERDLQTRFHDLTRRIHPDLFHGESPSTIALVNRAYRRVNEAYSVLKHKERRRAYDKTLRESRGAKNRISQEDLEQATRRAKIRRGETGVGDYYWRLAKGTLNRARGQSKAVAPALYEAACLLRTAMAFEPENEHFRGALEQINLRLSNLGY